MPASTSPGRSAREVLCALDSDIDFRAEAFPYMGVRTGRLGGIPVRVLRVGFVGELGYEIHCPSGLGEALVGQRSPRRAQPFGLKPFGVEAQRVLRLEKGHIIVGQDTDGLTHPVEAGMAWALAKTKPFYVGKRAVDIQVAKGVARRLVGFALPDITDALPQGVPPGDPRRVDRRTGDVGGALALARQGDRARLCAGRPRRRRRALRDPHRGWPHGRGGGGGDAVLRPPEQAAGAVMAGPQDFARRSPLARTLESEGAPWRALADAAIADAPDPGGAAARLSLADLSPLPRLGFKGRGTIPAMRARGPRARQRAEPGLPPGRRDALPGAGGERGGAARRPLGRGNAARRAGGGVRHRGGRGDLPGPAARRQRLDRGDRRDGAHDALDGVRGRPAHASLRRPRDRADIGRPPERGRRPGRHRSDAGVPPACRQRVRRVLLQLPARCRDSAGRRDRRGGRVAGPRGGDDQAGGGRVDRRGTVARGLVLGPGSACPGRGARQHPGGRDRARGAGVPQQARHHGVGPRGGDRPVPGHAVEDRERRDVALADDAAVPVAGARRAGHRLLPTLRGAARRGVRQGGRGPRHRAARHTGGAPVPSARPLRGEQRADRGRALSDHLDRGVGRVPAVPAFGAGVPVHAGGRGGLPPCRQAVHHAPGRQPVLRRRRPARARGDAAAADPVPVDHLLRPRRELTGGVSSGRGPA